MADWDVVSEEPFEQAPDQQAPQRNSWDVVEEKPLKGEWPGGASGWLKASGAGMLHGLTGVAGAPADLASALVNTGARALTMTPEEREKDRGALRRKYEPAPKGRRSEAPDERVQTSGEGFVGQYVDPVLPTSKWMRKVLDLPGHALGLEGNATYNNIKEVPEEYRPSARMGEAIGSALPFSWGAGAAGNTMRAGGLGASQQTSPSVVRNIINSQIEDQARYAGRTGAMTGLLPKSAQPTAQAIGDVWKTVSPLHHLGAQRASGIGAGVGAYGAELAFPGSDLSQFVGQLGGGLAGAGVGAGTQAVMGKAASRLAEPLSTLTPEGQKTAIARALEPQFKQYGEDPADIINRLRTPDEIPGALPAERSGSRVLMGAQRKLAEEDDVLANTINAQDQTFGNRVRAGVEEGFAPGEQQALSQSAREYDEVLRTQLADAESEVRGITANLAGLGPAEREAANVQATSILERALQRARTQERDLWSRTPDEAPVNPTNTINEYDAVASRMYGEQRLPGTLETTIERWRETGEPVPMWEVREFRSDLLAEARKANAAGDTNLGRKLNQIASGEAGEPRGRPGGALADMSEIGDPAVANARNFSVLLNDRFSRSFAGDLLGMSPEGGAAVRPGMALETTFAGNKPLVAQRLRELREAEAPIGQSPVRPVANLDTEMGQTQEQFLRTQVNGIITPDGRVKVGPAQEFLRKNDQILEQFPAFRAQIDDAIRAETAAQYLAVRTSDKDKMQVFAKLLSSGEKPAIAVGRVLSGANPVRDLQELSQFANRSGPDAVAGLRASIMSNVSDRAGGSFVKMQKLLNDPVTGKKGGPSLLTLMKNNRLLTNEQADKLSGSLALGARHESAPLDAVRVSSVGDEAGRNLRWGSRLIGAKLASWLGATGGGAGSSLQAAAIGASVAENALAKMPVARAREVLRKAMTSEDPQELISILEKISGPTTRMGRAPTTQPALVSLLRPLFPRTESEGTTDDSNQWQRMNWGSVMGNE